MSEFEIPLTQEEARRHPLAMQACGRPVSETTFWRWVNRGVRGIKLETEMRGGRRVVFPSAIQRFNQALSGQPVEAPPAARVTSEARQKRVAKLIARKRPRQTAGR